MLNLDRNSKVISQINKNEKSNNYNKENIKYSSRKGENNSSNVTKIKG